MTDGRGFVPISLAGPFSTIRDILLHPNTVESSFSLLKRGIVGTFHHVSKGHLYRYCDEFAFRYSTRTALGYDDGERAALLVLGAEGKRLT